MAQALSSGLLARLQGLGAGSSLFDPETGLTYQSNGVAGWGQDSTGAMAATEYYGYDAARTSAGQAYTKYDLAGNVKGEGLFQKIGASFGEFIAIGAALAASAWALGIAGPAGAGAGSGAGAGAGAATTSSPAAVAVSGAEVAAGAGGAAATAGAATASSVGGLITKAVGAITTIAGLSGGKGNAGAGAGVALSAAPAGYEPSPISGGGFLQSMSPAEIFIGLAAVSVAGFLIIKSSKG